MLKRSDMTPLVDLTAMPGTGPVRTRRPVYVDLLPPCSHACPAGEDIQAWLALAQAGDYRARVGAPGRRQPAAGDARAGLLPPVRNACNRGELDAPVSIHAVERFLGDRCRRTGLGVSAAAPASGKRVLVVGAGPSGLSGAYHLTRLGHAAEIHEAGPVAGGMMHFGIPAYRLPRAELHARDRPHRGVGRAGSCSTTRSTTCWPNATPAASTRCSSRSARSVGKHVDIPGARRRPRARCRQRCCTTSAPGNAAARPPRGRLRRRQHGDGRGAHRQRLGADEALIVYRRDRAHMPAHAFEADEALEEGVKIKWLTTIKEIAGRRAHRRADGRSTPTAGRTRPARFETLRGGCGRAGARPGQPTAASSAASPVSRFAPDGTVAVGPDMMTGHAGNIRRRRHGARRAAVTVAVGHGKRAARHIDAWLRGALMPSRRAASARDLRHAAPAGLQRRRPAAPARRSPLPSGSADSTRSSPASTPNRRAAMRRSAACPAATASNATTAMPPVPEDAIIKLGPGRRLSLRLREMHRLRRLLRAMPVPRHRR